MTIDDRIGQYRIVEQIGAGGMGRVCLGEHMLLGRRAAIKTLLPKHSVNPEIVERFFNEARATSAISDPGVIQIFDFGYHVDGTAYIVMELLEGEALSARIERVGRLSISETLRIARQGAGSLAAAHAHSIVHRDLKPENIFLVPDLEAQGGERTKILDFGICKLGGDYDGRVTEVGMTVGTPAYMAPEQCRGASTVDHRADIYAFGCLIFHMLTGRPPFEAEAPADYLVAHLLHAPVPPSACVPDLPPALDALVLRCLEKAPEARFQSMTALQAAIGEVAAQLQLSAVGTPAATPTLDMESKPKHEVAPSQPLELEARPRSRRTAIVGILVAGVMAAAVATYIMFNGEDASARAATPATLRAASVAVPPPDAAVALDAPIVIAPDAAMPPVAVPLAVEPPAPARVTQPPRRPAQTPPPPPRAPPTEDLYDTR